jgi:LacI family transcriptional regulator
MSPKEKPVRQKNENAPKRVTVRDIAAAMGIHFTTVAEALRGSSRISKKTQAAVNEVAKQMGYAPDPMMSALSNYRSTMLRGAFQGVIAWINVFKASDRMTDRVAFYGDCFWGASERARAFGFRLEEFILGDEPISSSRLSKILSSRNITGVIIGPLPRMTSELSLDWQDFVSVRIGYSYENPNLTVVVADQFRNAQWIFEKMHAAGFERIGFACPRFLDDRVSNKFSAGYLSMAYRFYGKPPLPLFIDDVPEGNKEAFLKWFHEYHPDGIILGGRSTYYRMLLNAGIRVPEDVQCVAMHAEHLKLPISGVSQNGEVVGATAVDHVVSMIQGFKKGLEPFPKTMMIHGRWIDGRRVA